VVDGNPTALLLAWRDGDQAAFDQLVPLVHDELRRIARQHVELDDALNALAAVDLRKSQVIEMRYFGGLSVEETADALRVSPGTVMRDWRLAKVWLLRELTRR
jgi:RNA polymerase sigma factor (sigma-70 family)